LLVKVGVLVNGVEKNFATFTVKDLSEKKYIFPGKKGG
jgi:hypothetical protein